MGAFSKAVEARAKDLYEQARKKVIGRPAWERLDPNDPYDMGMRETALQKAREDIAKADAAYMRDERPHAPSTLDDAHAQKRETGR